MKWVVTEYCSGTVQYIVEADTKEEAEDEFWSGRTFEVSDDSHDQGGIAEIVPIDEWGGSSQMTVDQAIDLYNATWRKVDNGMG